VSRACGPHLYSISVILGTRPIPKAILMIPLLLWSQPIQKRERANLSCDDRPRYQRRPRLHQGPALGAEGATRQPLHVDGSRPYKPKIHDGGDRAVQIQFATLFKRALRASSPQNLTQRSKYILDLSWKNPAPQGLVCNFAMLHCLVLAKRFSRSSLKLRRRFRRPSSVTSGWWTYDCFDP
jgi:hypothetical protein